MDGLRLCSVKVLREHILERLSQIARDISDDTILLYEAAPQATPGGNSTRLSSRSHGQSMDDSAATPNPSLATPQDASSTSLQDNKSFKQLRVLQNNISIHHINTNSILYAFVPVSDFSHKVILHLVRRVNFFLLSDHSHLMYCMYVCMYDTSVMCIPRVASMWVRHSSFPWTLCGPSGGCATLLGRSFCTSSVSAHSLFLTLIFTSLSSSCSCRS